MFIIRVLLWEADPFRRLISKMDLQKKRWNVLE
jgi:hypothetical protein